MDPVAVMNEVATVLKAITGLRAYAFQQGSTTAPAALVGWPDSIDYGQTYARGVTVIPDLPVFVLCGQVVQRVAAKRLGEYIAESGARSVPAKLEGAVWTTCDSVTVSSATFPAVKVGGIDFLGVEFHLKVIGKGA